MASIERLPRNQDQPVTGYAVRWRLGGRRGGAPQTLTFVVPPGARPHATRRLAEAAQRLAESRGHAVTQTEVRSAVLGGTRHTPAGVPTLAEWASDYIAGRRRAGDAQPDVLTKYEQALARYATPRIGHLPLTEISREHITDWLTWLKTQRRRDGGLLAAESVRRTHAILHGCLAAAVPRWIPTNPCARPPGARRRNAALPRAVRFPATFLEPWELDAVLAGCDPDFRDMVEVEARTGLRLGELLVLRPRDLVLGGSRAHIKVVRALKNDGTVGPPKSDTSARDVTVSSGVEHVLARLADGRRPDELLFTAPRGGMWSESNLRRRRWLPAVAAAQRCPEHPPPLPAAPRRGPRRGWLPGEVSTCGCPGVLRRTPRFHDLRHTHVGLLIAQGWMPKPIQVRMGHASIVVTMDIYGHLWEMADADRLDEVDRLLAGATPGTVVDVRPRTVARRRAPSRRTLLRLVAEDEAC